LTLESNAEDKMKVRKLSSRFKSTFFSIVVVTAVGGSALLTPLSSSAVFFARDPGVRGGTAAAGGPLPNVTANELTFFNDGLDTLMEVDGLADGLGPRFNLDGCAGCHAFPAPGGTAPPVNPQVALATQGGAQNLVPSFINIDGPIREARFVRNPDGTPDGGVHALFVISGRSDPDGTSAAGCHTPQEDFETQVNNHNIIFRIPTPLYGMGLIESIDDQTILNNIKANAAVKLSFGVRGHANHASGDGNISGTGNHNGNDGTIARTGWKAQNKSGFLFAGEAYNVEMGITNEVFQTEREEDPNCQFKGVPNDATNTEAMTPLEVSSDIVKFAMFMRFSAPPTPVSSYTGANGFVSSASVARGRQRFSDVGCDLCHTPTLTTSPAARSTALRNQPAHLYSDLAVHGMGPRLADGVSQGEAGGDEFRTAPLWGVGQRIFFLHDGRTRDIKEAIEQHRSRGNAQYRGSEANAVIGKFDALRADDQQDLLNFLRSL
jgi:CxxC motif-containing protein (DUF1111 family)